MAKPDIKYNFYDIVVVGLSDLLMHNGRTADPTDFYSKEMKKLSGKRKKVDADYEALADLEFKAGLYTHEGVITIPSQVLEACLVEGAKSCREGPLALSGMFVERNDIAFAFSGPQTPEERLKDPSCRDVSPVRVQRNKVMRCRPIFRAGWKLAFRVSVIASIVSAEQLENWIHSAGALRGIGDWRPRHGRFELESMKPVNPAKESA